MIVAVSTSSPVAGAALLDESGAVLASESVHAPAGAGAACLTILEGLLRRTDRSLDEATLFLADLGPGSFTGVRVGVALIKTWGLAFDKPVGGATSFDLIDPAGVVVIPSKRGEYFVREPGLEPVRTRELPEGAFTGFGPGVDPASYPSAEGFARLLEAVRRVKAEELAPNYVLEPSISTPKKPYGGPVRG